jgi:hypothetical protein
MAAWISDSFDVVCASNIATWASKFAFSDSSLEIVDAVESFQSCLLLLQFGDRGRVCSFQHSLVVLQLGDYIRVLRLQLVDSVVAGARDSHQRLGVLLAARPFCAEGVLKLFVLLPHLRDVLCIKVRLQFERLKPPE